VAAPGQRLVVLHAFMKKTATTPRSAIRIALERAKEVL
jgi:phage-related protein